MVVPILAVGIAGGISFLVGKFLPKKEETVIQQTTDLIRIATWAAIVLVAIIFIRRFTK